MDSEMSNQDEGKAHDAEMRLIHHTFEYKTKGVYPPHATKNEKRCIRRKAEKVVVRNGEIFYKKTKGREVSVNSSRTYITEDMWMKYLLSYIETIAFIVGVGARNARIEMEAVSLRIISLKCVRNHDVFGVYNIIVLHVCMYSCRTVQIS